MVILSGLRERAVMRACVKSAAISHAFCFKDDCRFFPSLQPGHAVLYPGLAEEMNGAEMIKVRLQSECFR